jgi:hypothetical protein
MSTARSSQGARSGERIIIDSLEQMVGSVTWHPVERIVEHLQGGGRDPG